jgi:hypothetical protein
MARAAGNVARAGIRRRPTSSFPTEPGARFNSRRTSIPNWWVASPTSCTGAAASISLFENQAQAEDSARRVAEWIGDNVASLSPKPAPVTTREVRVYAAPAPVSGLRGRTEMSDIQGVHAWVAGGQHGARFGILGNLV